ncbi:MAG TPA: CHAT domain-containing tetratricopeptide repeat protein [Pyrinomonadaceae bacterium]|nr:CHAT domain-containing tetratricopeptide repeat protein [Pyrinomonadaceae bacterium]
MAKNLLQLAVLLSALLSITVLPAPAQIPKDLPTLSDVQREIKGGETHSFRIQLTANQFVYALVQQDDVDVATSIYTPDGKQLTESDSPNDRWGTEPIVFVAAVPGEYRVQVKSWEGQDLRRYQIRVIALREATGIDKGHAVAQLSFDEATKLAQKQTAEATRAAIPKFEEAVPLFKAAGDTYRQALTLLSIGSAYYSSNEYRKALDYFNETLALAVALKDQKLEASTQTYVGGMLDILGDVSRALDHQQRALALARQGSNRLAEASALSNIGKIYNDVADWQKALEFYAQALPIFRSLGLKPNEAVTLHNIGIAHFQAGEHQKALDYLQQSLPLVREAGNKISEANTLVNIARIYRRSGDNKKAFDYLNQAHAMQKQAGNKAQEGETLDEIGLTWLAERQPTKALDYHLQAVEIQRAVGSMRREAVALINVGEAYTDLNQPEKALEPLNNAVAMLRSISDLSNVAIAMARLARAEQKRNNLDAAHKYITESLAAIETVRSRAISLQMRASYRALAEESYEFYIDVLMQQHAQNPSHGFAVRAFEASERGRARSFLERLNERRVDIRQGVDAALIEKERNLAQVLNAKAQREMQLKARKGNKEEIATLQREISAHEDEYQQVQAAIRTSSPQYSALTQPQPLGLKEIQPHLDADTVLLEYSLGETRSYLWAVTNDSLKSYELPKQDVIDKAARDVYASLTARSVVKSLEAPEARKARIALADQKFQKAAAELGRIILAPAAADLRGKRLVIVADGALQYVPFAALSVSDNRPLILDHELISLPSASAFAIHRQNLANRTAAPKAVAVIADPVFSTNDARLRGNARTAAPREQVATRIIEHTEGGPGGQMSISRLPFTRSEADQIVAVAPAASSMKALDFRASREIATSDELSKYRYVHFATHGYLDTSRAGLSAIVLSLVDEQGKPQDGFLRTHDIYNLKLPAELVVLSACETGLGKDLEGEGIDGLTRAFMYAGARRVVVSLWNVNDKATASLMQRLYAGMLRSNKSPAAALRAAQIEMLRTRQWQSPYFWAAFVMQGEWRQDLHD